MELFTKGDSVGLANANTADGKMMDGESIIQSMVNELGNEFNLFGGMAGDDMTFTGTYVFTNNQSTGYGMTALVLDADKIDLHGMA